MGYMSEMTETAVVGVPALTLGWRLQMAMAHGGQTRYSMADTLGVGISTITRWTSDKSKPKRAYVAQWALATGVPVEWLETGHVSAESPDDGGMVTTGGESPDMLPFLGFTGILLGRSSHAAPVDSWQLPASPLRPTGMTDLPGGGMWINEARTQTSRRSAQNASSTAENYSDLKVAS